MIETVFLAALFMFSCFSLWYIYVYHYKKNTWHEELYHAKILPQEFSDKVIEYATNRKWTVKRMRENLVELDVPISSFFWGAKVFISIDSIGDGINVKISRKPNFVSSQIQDSILEKEILGLLGMLGLTKKIEMV